MVILESNPQKFHHLTLGVLALQGDFREHEAALHRAGANRVVRVREAEDLSGLSGLVIPGGESTTIAKLAERCGLFHPIKSAITSGLPVYGSCAGMILLANDIVDYPDQPTFGGLDIRVERNAFGSQVNSHEVDLDFSPLTDGPVQAVFIRAPIVHEVGPEVTVLARTSPETTGKAGKIVAVRQNMLLATAFHPEMVEDSRIHRYFLQMCETNRTQ